jgi:hypothetical protein
MEGITRVIGGRQGSLPTRQSHLLLHHLKEKHMSIGLIVLIILILLLIGAIPSWPHSKGWGYGPSGGLGLVVLILIILLVMGKL